MGRAITSKTIASVFALAVAGCSLVPTPLSESEIASRSDPLITSVVREQEPVSIAIDLYEAMARALKYNLDHQVEIAEAALRLRESDLAHYSLLPNLVANSGYAARDRVHASNSVNIFTGAESLAFSTSQDQRIRTADIAFSWNVLDFGLSYVRARQAGDKYLIAEELRRKVQNRVVEDVRSVYWRAVSAQRMTAKLKELEQRVLKAQSNAESISAERQTSPITAATYVRELVEIKRTIQELERDLSVAKTQLSSLMNLKPGTAFRLAGAARHRGDMNLEGSADDLVGVALRQRPELREVWYRKRINEQELHAAFLELLPGLQVFRGSNFDSNDFLFHNNWVNWGAKATWNLMRIVQYPAKRAVIEGQDSLLDERERAVALAVMTQVHVSRIRFIHARKELSTAVEYLAAQQRIVDLMRQEGAANRVSEQTLIREEMNLLVAEVRRDIAYANLQNAFANVYASVGTSVYAPAEMQAGTVKDVARQLRTMWFERGDFAAGGRTTKVAGVR